MWIHRLSAFISGKNLYLFRCSIEIEIEIEIGIEIESVEGF
jgi:hypothetical protein